MVSKDNCKGCFISENVLKRTVLRELNELINKYLNANKLEENIIMDKIKNKKEKINSEILQYKTNISKQVQAIKNLYLDKINGLITPELFIELSEDFRKEKERLEKLLENNQAKLLEFDNEKEILDSKRKILEKYINVTELRREMVDSLIDYIVISEKNPATKKKTIEIHWKI